MPLARPIRTALFVVTATVLPASLSAQLISLKTVPVPNGEQFLLLPSRTLGMGGVSIAVPDPIPDAFANPAKGARLDGLRIFGAPVFYDVSDDNGGGASLPIGAVLREGRWFGGVALAMQQLRDPVDNGFCCFIEGDDPFDSQLRDNSPANTYMRAAAGVALGEEGHTSIGASVFRAELSAMDGAALLFGGSMRLAQDGGVTDYRAGVLHELRDGGWLEAVVVHNRLDMTHDAQYVEWVWDEPFVSGQPVARLESNLDRTRTTGVHLAAVRPMSTPGLSVGGIFTFNRKTHPKIPNYSLVRIPRDPGNSTAFNVGVGLSHTEGESTFGVDLVWEPARSHTWAEADEPVERTDGSEIAAGGRTIENWFRFSNLRFAAGLDHDGQRGGWQIGLAMKMYDYRLRQENYVEDTTRRTHDSWFEWAPTWGFVLKRSGLELRYSGRLSMRGFPDLFGSERVAVAVPDAGGGPDILAAPTGPVSLPEYHTFTNQFSVAILIGGAR